MAGAADTMSDSLRLGLAAVAADRALIALGDMPADQSWRKYRIALGLLDSVSVNTTANIRAVTHVRLWYENDTPLATPVKKLQLSELRLNVQGHLQSASALRASLQAL